MRKRKKDPATPFETNRLAPPPTWQVVDHPPRPEPDVSPPAPPDSWPQAPESIRRKMFPDVRRGYDPKQVHAYLAQVADALEAWEREGWRVSASDVQPAIPPDKIRARQFATVRRGFDPESVRRYLDRVADQLEATE